jgi:hypothetical protein
MLIKARFVALAVSLCWMVGAYAQYGSSNGNEVRFRDNANDVRFRDTERRIDVLESMKIGDQLARITTLLEVNARASESTHNTMLAFGVPVVVLSLEALFRLLAGLKLRG